MLLSASSLVYPGADGHLVYVPDAQGNTIPDFSTVGYLGGAVPLPDTPGGAQVPTRVTLHPAPGDATARIQAALDQVGALPLDANGFRGAVYLTAGTYDISDHIEIRASGVVLRGAGQSTSGTVLYATGTGRRYDANDPLQDGLVQLKGQIPAGVHLLGSGALPKVAGTEHAIVDPYVPVGATTFTAGSTAGLSVGDAVIVHRPSPANWIHDIGMDVAPNPWQPGTRDLDSDRVITAIDGNRVTIDAPLTNALDQQYGGGTLYKYSFPGRIFNVGVESVRGDSAFNPDVRDAQGHQVDEDHAWDFITTVGVENAFVRHVAAAHFAFSAVDVLKTSKWVTVEDAHSRTPVSLVSGDRRYSFEVAGQLTLVKDCDAFQGRHDFALGSIVPGPNAFVNCTAEGAYDESGPHHTWSTGALFDNVVVRATTEPGHPAAGDLGAYNRGHDSAGSLQGWSGANMVFWNSTAQRMRVEQPPTAQNYAIGCTADSYSGDGYFESSGTPVEPASLYEAQLQDRLALPSPAGPPAGAALVSATLRTAADGAAVAPAGKQARSAASREPGSEGAWLPASWGAAQPTLPSRANRALDHATPRSHADGFAAPPWACHLLGADWLREPLGIR
jgi:hypothetical protein